jgi:predicted ATPase
MRPMDISGNCQVIMANHSPVLMAYPDARLLRLTKYGLEPVSVKEMDHYKIKREFCDDPAGFVEAAIEE